MTSQNLTIFDLMNTNQLLNSAVFLPSTPGKAQTNCTIFIYPFSYKDHNKSKDMLIGVGTRASERNADNDRFNSVQSGC